MLPIAEIVGLPLADGGEGTVEALVTATRGHFVSSTVTGPLGKPVEAWWGILGDDITAVIEIAAAAGLPLVPPELRNPLRTTTYGAGELIRAALEVGCTRIIIGLGGSATNDGGAGIAQALGAELLDEAGDPIGRGGGALAHLDKIRLDKLDPRLQKTQILLAADVSNPLYGPQGAAATYGPQKGAPPEMVEVLDKALQHYAEVIERELKLEVAQVAGSGAAGGAGAGLMVFLNARLHRGITLILETLHFEEYLQAADLVITGEGKIDTQIQYGKAIAGVGSLGRRAGVPVVALAGAIEIDGESLEEFGIQAALPCLNRPTTEAEAMANAAELVQEAAERLMRLVLVGDKISRRWQEER